MVIQRGFVWTMEDIHLPVRGVTDVPGTAAHRTWTDLPSIVLTDLQLTCSAHRKFYSRCPMHSAHRTTDFPCTVALEFQLTSHVQCPLNYNWPPMHSPTELQLTSHGQCPSNYNWPPMDSAHQTTTDLPWTVPQNSDWPPMHRPTELQQASHAQTHRTTTDLPWTVPTELQLTSHAQTHRTPTDLSCTDPQNSNSPLMHRPTKLQFTSHAQTHITPTDLPCIVPREELISHAQTHRTPTDLSCTDAQNSSRPPMHRPIELQLTSHA